ncbi:uncharacterized protein LOC141529376 [Cotesia typhae]|uniref:uncharacterized protein LOC141529376 n=1 Tax=Cotesia typhae TaxID=2053667 RepID=UPI003D68831D
MYTWINGPPSRWKEFVHNRVCFLQETLPAVKWWFVPEKTNPADCATRGLSPTEFIPHSLWWDGPSWLSQPLEFWPNKVQADYSPENLEERSATVNVISQIRESVLHQMFERAWTLKILIGATVIFNRAVERFKRHNNASLLNNPICPGDLEEARIYWIKQVQEQSFPQELQILKKGEQLPKNHPLVRLTPWLNPAGILRVGGRLQNSNLNSDAKHSIILPRRNHLSTLVIRDGHHKTLHGGTQLTLAYICNNN